MLDYENDDNPDEEKKNQIAAWETLASQIITHTSEVDARANALIPLGIRVKDALHIACAIAAGAEYFITTDKKVLNKTVAGITIINPIDFVRRHFREN
jgi:predicted nucleic acid-binding protein